MIGIFGGTFDPIHHGHLNLAIRIFEIHNLQEVWFIPARYSPFKSQEESSFVDLRKKMVEIGIEDIPHFKMLDIETKRRGPSYTIDTLRLLTKEYPNLQFRLLMGDDSMHSFHQWKDAKEILKLAPPLIGCRSRNQTVIQNESFYPELHQGLTPIPVLEISSTEIRKRVSKGLYVSHLLPLKVVDFIIQNRLYL